MTNNTKEQGTITKILDFIIPKKVERSDFTVALLFGCIIIGGLLWKAGTLNSGYHFTDDHELIRLELNFTQQGMSLGEVMKNWVLNDFWWRFRPLYWIERVTGAYFWGSELLYWNYYTAIKGILAFACLYLMSRYLKFDRIISVLVPCVVMLGKQFTPWYRSANQESTGLLLCAVSLCLIAAQAYHKKYTDWRYNVPIIISAVLCGLVKESFTLFMPVFVGLKYWLEYWDESNAHTEKGRLLKCLKSNGITYGCILLSMLVNVCLILFYVGVDNVSYAGFQEGTPLSVYWFGIKTSLMKYTKWYTIIGAVILLLTIVFRKSIEKKDIPKYTGLALIAVGACAIQLVAHAKSGMWDRYIIPYIVGYVFVFILLTWRMLEMNSVYRFLFLCIMAFLLYQNVLPGYRAAQSYRLDGENIARFLDYLHTQTEEQNQVICAFRDGELNLAVECWMETNERTQIYSYENGMWNNHVQLAGNAPEEYSWSNARAAVCYSSQAGDVINLMGFTAEEQYEVVNFWNYSIVFRK